MHYLFLLIPALLSRNLFVFVLILIALIGRRHSKEERAALIAAIGEAFPVHQNVPEQKKDRKSQ